MKFEKLVPRPTKQTIIETKWIFRNKVRLIVYGFNQEKGIDYE